MAHVSKSVGTSVVGTANRGLKLAMTPEAMAAERAAANFSFLINNRLIIQVH